ncbi:STY4534 family ICE replication protein [Pseudomonas sp. MT3]
MSNQAKETKYFDLHTGGIGYLNRIREVKPRKGNPFLAVTVAALRGSTDDVEYSYIDCNVVGAEAEKLVRRCQQAVDAGKKVLVSFRIGDIWADAFTYEKGEKQGQPGASLKGRLLFIGFIKVDGETVYEAKPKDSVDQAPQQDGTASDAPAAEQQQQQGDQFAA